MEESQYMAQQHAWPQPTSPEEDTGANQSHQVHFRDALFLRLIKERLSTVVRHLQDSGELGVSVGDVLAARPFCQRANHIAQRKQALVDIDSLCKLLSCCPCLLCPLAACNVRLRVDSNIYVAMGRRISQLA